MYANGGVLQFYDVHQGTNAMKVISEQGTNSLYIWSQPDMESIVSNIIYEIFWS